MKDTLITARRKKIELRTWLICFVIANACNLYAILCCLFQIYIVVACTAH